MRKLGAFERLKATIIQMVYPTVGIYGNVHHLKVTLPFTMFLPQLLLSV